MLLPIRGSPKELKGGERVGTEPVFLAIMSARLEVPVDECSVVPNKLPRPLREDPPAPFCPRENSDAHSL